MSNQAKHCAEIIKKAVHRGMMIVTSIKKRTEGFVLWLLKLVLSLLQSVYRKLTIKRHFREKGH